MLEINLLKSGSPEELRDHAAQLSETKDQVIIDTSGLNPFSAEDVKILAKLIVAVDARPILVLPGGIDAEESGEIARVFATIGATELLPTRIDMTRRLGGILASAHHGSLSLSDYSNTPMVAQGLAPMSPKALSRLLMPGVFRETRTRRIIKPLQKSGSRQ